MAYFRRHEAGREAGAWWFFAIRLRTWSRLLWILQDISWVVKDAWSILYFSIFEIQRHGWSAHVPTWYRSAEVSDHARDGRLYIGLRWILWSASPNRPLRSISALLLWSHVASCFYLSFLCNSGSHFLIFKVIVMTSLHMLSHICITTCAVPPRSFYLDRTSLATTLSQWFRQSHLFPFRCKSVTLHVQAGVRDHQPCFEMGIYVG